MTVATTKPKPLGKKNYGSIPHLPGSRMGPADHHCHEGQARIALTKTRDKHDLVIVQEKLDGSNVGIANVEGTIVPLTRAGWRAETSPYEQHHHFARWVLQRDERWRAVLQPGDRIVGEWLMQAHGTRYDLKHEPFVMFDAWRGDVRLNHADMEEWAANLNATVPHVYHRCLSAFAMDEAEEALKGSMHGAIDAVEGLIWRVERKGVLDYVVKYVRPDKTDGIYLPEVSGKPVVWMFILNAKRSTASSASLRYET